MRTRSSLLAVLFAALLAGGTLAGCGAADSGTGNAQQNQPAQSGGNVPSTPITGGSASLPPGAKVSPPRGATPTTPEFTITGIPQEGVESGCIVMRSGELLYNLIGGDRQTLMSGRTVVVRGRPTPGLVTTCQQGTPFQVSEVRLA